MDQPDGAEVIQFPASEPPKFTVILTEFSDGDMHIKLNLLQRDAKTRLMVAHALREMAEALEEGL